MPAKNQRDGMTKAANGTLIGRGAETPLIDPFGRAISYLRVSVTDRCDYAPGLGIEINEEALAAHPYQVHELRHYTGALTAIRPPDATKTF
jgi:galactonate dehydratase